MALVCFATRKVDDLAAPEHTTIYVLMFILSASGVGGEN